MTADEYLRNVLDAQRLTDDQLKVLSKHRDEIESLFREKFGTSPIIKYGGSKAKGTMIKESYDLDIVCYFLHKYEKNLKEIYVDARKCLEDKYTIDPKTSALRIKAVNEQGLMVDYHIDVVPGKFCDESNGDAFLYFAGTQKDRLKTNIKVHIDYVSGSNYRDVIKILKLWRTRNSLSIKTFVLELLTVEHLRKKSSQLGLSGALEFVLGKIKDDIQTMRLVDPANSNNVISDLLSDADKMLISEKASEAVKVLDNKEYGEEEKWKIILQYPPSIEKANRGPAIIFNKKPEGSWCASR